MRVEMECVSIIRLICKYYMNKSKTGMPCFYVTDIVRSLAKLRSVWTA